MQHRGVLLSRLLVVPMMLSLFAAGCDTMNMNNNNNNNGNNNGNSNNNGNNNNNDNDAPSIFVVNNTLRVTSYFNAALADGEVVPTTELPAGATTDIFQPRSVVVTKDEVLIVSRQNGGLSVHDDALTVSGDTPADRVVDGNNTLCTAPISFAYDASTDDLYVGNINASDGILVFDDVSSAAFNGDIAPDRKFNPSDRAPTTGVQMTIDAMWLDSNGNLFVADTSGTNVNSSRILVYFNPESATGSVDPDAILTSSSWAGVQDIAVDTAGNLYVADGSENVFVFANAASLDGAVTPDATLTFPGVNVAIEGVWVDSNGVGYITDRSNAELHKLIDIAMLDGNVTPDSTISGFDSRLGAPRQIWVVEPQP